MRKRQALIFSALLILAAVISWIVFARVKPVSIGNTPVHVSEATSLPESEKTEINELGMKSRESQAPLSSLPKDPATAVPKQGALPPSGRLDLQDPLAPASIPEGPVPRPAEEDAETAVILDQVALMIRDYRTITGENPVGTNGEIMKAMMGKNPRGAKLGPPEGMSLNGEGELLDRWGTPIFFHQISRDVMEIHSAGPDLRMGTEDDLILK